MADLDTAQQWNAAAFVLHNHIVNENAVPIEFHDHRFLAQPYMDNTPRQVVRKAGQIGWSTLAIIRAFHLANFYKANIIYTLPSKSIVKDFVTPKVDPLVENNPVLKAMIGNVDSMGLKAIGDRFVYFRSSWDEASGIAISADILISDELDRSNPKAIRTYKTRLDASKMTRPDLGWFWQFSNPTIPGNGVDEWWEQSDQKHWFIRCSHCNFDQFLQFPDNINFEKKEYMCSRCQRDLNRDTRTKGHWLRKRVSDISGYWISQMMVPWHSAAKIIEDSEGDQSVFHNFTLGLPYQPKDQSVSRADIIRCIVPTVNPRTDVAIGVDNGIVKTYVVGNKYGIFRVGETEDWQEIEDLRNQYNAYMVIDANPYPTPAKKLVDKYRGKVFIHYYKQDRKNLGTTEWGESENFGVVYSDRTKVIDAVVADIMSQDIVFNLSETELENAGYVFHWQQMYRTVVETEKGIRVAAWEHPEGKPDHFAHGTVLWKVAMLKTLFHGGVVVNKQTSQELANPVIVNNSMENPLDIQAMIKRASQKKKDWRAI